MQFRKAIVDDIEAIAALVNRSYRSGEGWTHEGELLDGSRINSEMLAQLLTEPDSHLETLWSGPQLLGCVHLRRTSSCHLGLLTVDTGHQQQGLGRQLLDRAKEVALGWNCPSIVLTVIAQRTELVAYYERRGYLATGLRFPFPYQEPVGRAKRLDLELLEMSLNLAVSPLGC